MTRALLVLALLSVAPPPSVADAQVRANRPGSVRAPRERRQERRGSTRGSTRGSARVRDRGRSPRVRRRGYGYDPCWDGYCGAGYTGDSRFGLGISLGVVSGLYQSDHNGLRTSRVSGDVTAGLLPDVGVDFRMWGLFGRGRIGVAIQSGSVFATDARPLNGGAFEDGSVLTDGWFLGVWMVGAYQPQIDDVLQLWLGGRLGFHMVELGVSVLGRRYDDVDRFDLSGGPELGVRLSAGQAGLVLLGFADLAQPGHGQLSLLLVWETEKPPGPAW